MCPPRIRRNIVAHSYKKTLFYLVGYFELEIHEVKFEKTSRHPNEIEAGRMSLATSAPAKNRGGV